MTQVPKFNSLVALLGIRAKCGSWDVLGTIQRSFLMSFGVLKGASEAVLDAFV